MKQYSLTPEQKEKVLRYWKEKEGKGEEPNLRELSFYVFGEGIDGRSKEGRALKDFLAEYEIKPKGAQVYKAKERKTLTQEQKDYIENNCGNMSALEMSRVLFKDNKLSNFSVEARTVDEFIVDLKPVTVYQPHEQLSKEEWKAPNTLDRTIARINKHFKMGGGIDRDKMSAREQRQAESLMRYINTFRFEVQINAYDEERDRELFESVFVRYTYDKEDLTEEEADQYTILAGESVMERKIKKRSEYLQKLLDVQTGVDGDENERAKVSMSLVEAIGKSTSELNACNKRQLDLVNALKQKRSDRLSKRVQENASILNLIDTWKSAKTRKELLILAERRKGKVEEAIEELASMDDVQAKVLGISKSEALHG